MKGSELRRERSKPEEGDCSLEIRHKLVLNVANSRVVEQTSYSYTFVYSDSYASYSYRPFVHSDLYTDDS